MKRSPHLTEGPIETGYISRNAAELSSDTRIGSHSIFLGQVRADPVAGTVVSGIEYSAYDGMVDEVVLDIRERLFKRYPDLIVLHILHSTGFVPAGGISLFVAASTVHRTAAFRVVEECVELIKKSLPVWKKEVLADGSSRWIT